MLISLWIKPLIAIAFCIFLIYRCFQPYFVNPEKVINSDWIYNNPNRLNIIGKLITAIVITFTVFFLIVPAAKDTYNMSSDNYIYAVVETKSDYHINSNSAKNGRVGVILHEEYIYHPDENGIEYDPNKDKPDKPSEDLYTGLTDYKKGEYYLVKYLPNTFEAEVLWRFEDDDIEIYK